jgi:KaiC/GvpD/RAD55 family RecA-like ATPase
MISDDDLFAEVDAPAGLSAALECAARGWHVFPCGADKQPLTRHGFKDATTDPGLVRSMWAECPHASIGIATGASGLVVVDIDCKGGKPGEEEWHRLKGELGEGIEATTLVETPSGGMHVYYRANGHRVGCTTERLAPGIDTRAEGGYVIAAGSPGYLYVDDHGPESLTTMPDGLAKRLEFAPAKPAQTHEGVIPEGRRDSTLASLAGTMRRRGISEDAIYAALAAENKKSCKPPLPDDQVRKIARSIGKKEPAKPVQVETGADGNPDSMVVSPFIDWSTFWIEDDQPEWAYPDILAWGRGHALYAAHKAGKSLLMLYIAAKVATETGHHCLYVDYEMTERDVRDRLAEMGYGPESDLERLHYALLPKMPPLDTEPGGQALMDLLDTAAVGAPEAHFVVVIDTISRAVRGEENDADTWRFFYLYTGMRLKQRGCTWMRLDHAGKDAERGQRGSSSKGDDVDIVWKLTVTQNGVQLKRELSRIGWVPEKVTLLKKDSPLLHYIRAISDDPDGTLEVVQLLDALKVPGDATNATSRKMLRGAGHHFANDVISASVRWRQMAFRESAERRQPFRARTEARDDLEQDDISLRNDSRNAAERVSRQGTERTPTLVEGGSGTCPADFTIDIGDMP